MKKKFSNADFLSSHRANVPSHRAAIPGRHTEPFFKTKLILMPKFQKKVSKWDNGDGQSSTRCSFVFFSIKIFLEQRLRLTAIVVVTQSKCSVTLSRFSSKYLKLHKT